MSSGYADIAGGSDGDGPRLNIALYPWFKAFQNLSFWHAVWFLYFQDTLSAAEAVMLYAIYDIGVTVLEVPSGYMSDRLGRRRTLIAAAVAGGLGALLLVLGGSFWVFALAQVLLGAGMAFSSGTDSALLYESLEASGCTDAVEQEELRAWRFQFVALALSAVIGGAMALWHPVLPFAAGVAAALAMLWVALRFAEPAHRSAQEFAGEAPMQLASLWRALRQPVLGWLFALGVAMYGFSHVPYVFGQPFILEALSGTWLAGEVPLVSGAVTATMMGISVLASLVAPGLRARLGLPVLLLTAFGMQIALCAVLAMSQSALVIAVLFLRMVPDSLSEPFMLARMQPLLASDSRATYLSLQSFAGRLLFAATLMLASGAAGGDGPMAAAEIGQVLGWYALGGVVVLAGLVVAARQIRLDD